MRGEAREQREALTPLSPLFLSHFTTSTPSHCTAGCAAMDTVQAYLSLSAQDKASPTTGAPLLAVLLNGELQQQLRTP